MTALQRLLSVQPAEPPSAAIVVAHPDDESIGAASLLRRLPRVHVVVATDGAPRNLYDARNYGFSTWQEYAAARAAELRAAIAEAGLPSDHLVHLNYPDQQAAFVLADLARDVGERLREWRPEYVLTHPYEGGHPDHDAVAFAVHAAAAMVANPPAIVEMPYYHAAEETSVTAAFAPREGSPEVEVPLTDADRDLKRRMFQAHKTQWHMLEHWPLDVERFRIAPRYDFARPSHAGKLHYEKFDWGMTAELWCSLVTAALKELGITRLP